MENHGSRQNIAKGLPDRQRGFTLLEMTVGIIIFAIVLLSIYSLLEVARRGRFNTLERSDTGQEVRIALNTMARDALNAGINYSNSGSQIPTNWLHNNLGQAANATNNPDLLSPVIPGPGLGATFNGTATSEVTFVSQVPTFNGGVPINVSAIVPSGVNLTVADNSNCAVGDIYAVFNNNVPNGALGVVTALPSKTKIVMAASDPLGFNNPNNGVPNPSLVGALSPPAAISKIAMVTYLVTDDGTGNGTGTLIRRVYGGADPKTGQVLGATDQPLAFGIVNMTIQYVLADGTVTQTPSAANLQNIRQLTVTVGVRSAQPDPSTKQYYTNTLTSTFNTRNLGYEKN